MADKVYLYATEVQQTLEGPATAWFCVKAVDKAEAPDEAEALLAIRGKDSLVKNSLVLVIDPEEHAATLFSMRERIDTESGKSLGVAPYVQNGSRLMFNAKMAPDGARSVLEDAIERHANQHATLEIQSTGHGVESTDIGGVDPTDPHGTQRR